MRRWIVALGLLGIAAAACGGDDAPQCILDTDCPLGQRCSSDKCVQRGAPARRDSGPTGGEAGVPDTGVTDSGVPDPFDMGFPPPFDMGFPPPFDMGFPPPFDAGPSDEAGLPESGPIDGGAGDGAMMGMPAP